MRCEKSKDLRQVGQNIELQSPLCNIEDVKKNKQVLV